MKQYKRVAKRNRDWSGSALFNKSRNYFSKTTDIGKKRRASLAQAYKTSRKTGKSLDQLRRGS